MRTRAAFLPLVLGALACAQTPGTFSPTGNMLTPRISHTATLLPNGKVLIAGGSTTCTPNCLPAGRPATLTAVYFIALLNDGRVLLIAVGAQNSTLPSREPSAPSPTGRGKTYRTLDATASSYWYPVVLGGGDLRSATGTFNLTGALGYFLGVASRTLQPREIVRPHGGNIRQQREHVHPPGGPLGYSATRRHKFW